MYLLKRREGRSPGINWLLIERQGVWGVSPLKDTDADVQFSVGFIEVCVCGSLAFTHNKPRMYRRKLETNKGKARAIHRYIRRKTKPKQYGISHTRVVRSIASEWLWCVHECRTYEKSPRIQYNWTVKLLNNMGFPTPSVFDFAMISLFGCVFLFVSVFVRIQQGYGCFLIFFLFSTVP